MCCSAVPRNVRLSASASRAAGVSAANGTARTENLSPQTDPDTSNLCRCDNTGANPDPKRPALIANPALNARRGFCGINRIKDLGLRGIEGHGLVEAVGPVVQPCGAVMPDEGVKACEIIARWIDPFPSLGTVSADTDSIYDARRGMILL
jgi:hypothetical protein